MQGCLFKQTKLIMERRWDLTIKSLCVLYKFGVWYLSKKYIMAISFLKDIRFTIK